MALKCPNFKNLIFGCFACLVIFGSLPAYAACSSPSGVSGSINYEDSIKTFSICDGTNWKVMNTIDYSGTAVKENAQIGYDTGTCTSAKLGRLRYNGVSSWQYCNGSSWQNLTSADDPVSGSYGYVQFYSAGVHASSSSFKISAGNNFQWGISSIFNAAQGGTAWGSQTAVSGMRSTAWGFQTDAGNNESTAWGSNTLAKGPQSTAWGQESQATNYYDTAFGYNTRATGSYSTAWGSYSQATDMYSTAWGSGTYATNDGATAWGAYTNASGSYSTAWGQSTTAGGAHTTALGYMARANGNSSLAIGLQTASQGTYPTVAGTRSLGIFMDGGVANANNGVSITANDVMVLYGGSFGIGDITPDAELDVEGDIEYTGTIQDVSDIRLKDNIQPLENSLDSLMQLEPISFTMKSTPKGPIEFGLSAQQLRIVYPNLVVENSDEDKTLTANYIGLIGPLIDAVKELKRTNEALKVRIEALENEQQQ